LTSIMGKLFSTYFFAYVIIMLYYSILIPGENKAVSYLVNSRSQIPWAFFWLCFRWFFMQHEHILMSPCEVK
jgi:hypothetical protein